MDRVLGGAGDRGIEETKLFQTIYSRSAEAISKENENWIVWGWLIYFYGWQSLYFVGRGCWSPLKQQRLPPFNTCW